MTDSTDRGEVLLVAPAGRLGDGLAAAVGESCRRLDPARDPDDLAGFGTLVYCVPGDARARPRQHDAALRRAAALFVAAVEAGVGHLVVVSHAAVHEPHHHHAGLVDEERWTPRRGNAVARRFLALEEAAKDAAGGAACLTVLRPAAVPTRDGHDFFSRLFRRRLALVPAGFDPTLQLLDVRDLAAAVRRAVERGSEPGYGGGVFQLAPTRAIPLKRALAEAGVLRLPLPWTVQRLLRAVFSPLGWMAPIDELDYVRYPFTISDQRARHELAACERSSWRAVRALRRGDEETPSREPDFDDFGLDRAYVDRLGKTLFRFLHDAWWRVEHTGLEHVPREGRVVLTGVHRGHQPWDGVMTLHLLARELGRYPRFLIHPTLVKFPHLAPYMIKCGGVHACRENAAWVLEQDEVVAIYPEGIRGAFRMYRGVYKLGKFGRDEYVKMALRHRAPIVPYVTVGSAEIFPILGRIDWSWWKRLSEWPYLPVTPTMGTIPLPSKWHTRFLEPVPVAADWGPEAAEDRRLVAEIGREVKGRMQAAIDDMLKRRKSVFFGSIFNEPTTGKVP